MKLRPRVGRNRAPWLLEEGTAGCPAYGSAPLPPWHLGTSPASQESRAELLAHLTAVTYYSSVLAPRRYLRVLTDKRARLSPPLPVLGRAGKDIAVYL